MNHTPEPWEIWSDKDEHGDKFYHISSKDPKTIGSVCREISHLPDAKLIASAPRLKRENQELKKRIEELRSMLEAKT